MSDRFHLNVLHSIFVLYSSSQGALLNFPIFHPNSKNLKNTIIKGQMILCCNIHLNLFMILFITKKLTGNHDLDTMQYQARACRTLCKYLKVVM